MTKITITLPDDRITKLREIAAHFGVTAEELARVGLEEFLCRPEETFQEAVDYVLHKNVELYRRLA